MQKRLGSKRFTGLLIGAKFDDSMLLLLLLLLFLLLLLLLLLLLFLLPTRTMLVGVGRIFESVCLSVCLSAA